MFELCACHEFDMVPWASLPAAALARASTTAARKQTRGKKLCDHGVDCATPDLRHVAQAKWWKPGTKVTYRALSTFFTLGSGILRAETLLLVTGEGVAMDELAGEVYNVRHVQITNARIDELVGQAAAQCDEPEPADPALPDDESAENVLPEHAAAPTRRYTNANRLTCERAAELLAELLAIAIPASNRTIDAHIDQIRQFAAAHGRQPTLVDIYDGKCFGAWLTHYHRVGGNYQKSLTLVHQLRLASIPGWQFSEEAYSAGRTLLIGLV
jgi:hypothetical protein